MKNKLESLAKGFIGIFMIKLLLAGSIFLIQSCDLESEIFDNTEEQIALQKFESLVRKETVRFKKIIDKQNSLSNDGSLNSLDSQNQIKEEATKALLPLIQATFELFSNYGIYESDFLEELEPEDPRIVILGLALLSAKSQDKAVAINLSELFGSNLYAQNTYDCALRAFGIDVVVEFFKGNVDKVIAKKALKKIASRVIGPVGAAWAAYEFGSCMAWY